MKSIGIMPMRDVPDNTFISAVENEKDIRYIYLKLATIPAEVNHGVEEVSMYAYGNFPCCTENTSRLVYTYDYEKVLKKWNKTENARRI